MLTEGAEFLWFITTDISVLFKMKGTRLKYNSKKENLFEKMLEAIEAIKMTINYKKLHFNFYRSIAKEQI